MRTTTFRWFASALKFCLSVSLAVLAALMASNALAKPEMSYVYAGVTAVLLMLAWSPWMLPAFRLFI
ncbi:MAG TPA: hypothetical protein VGC70_12455, partial [Burkholderiales bacterium]